MAKQPAGDDSVGRMQFLLTLRRRGIGDATVLLLLAGTVPVMTFVVERWMMRRYINPALDEQAPQATPVSP